MVKPTSRSRLGLELLRLVPIAGIINGQITSSIIPVIYVKDPLDIREACYGILYPRNLQA